MTDNNNINMNTTNDENTSEYEEFCYICRRPESIAGKLIKIQPNLPICPDCMQKTFDSMNNMPFGFGDMMGFPGGMNIPFGTTPVPNEFKEVDTDEPKASEIAGDSDTDAKNGDENKDSSKSSDKKDNGLHNIAGGFPNIQFVNLADMGMGMPGQQRVKKKKKEKKAAPVIDINSIPAPHRIKASLDEYVVGQEQAKKIMSVAVYNHYKRIMSKVEEDGVEIEKSNMLMVGPTGSGKTYLVKTLARLLDVPLAITDATSLTEAGYIGDDIESVVSKLLAAADNDVERAEHGIIFIDEIDKIAKKRNANQRDVSGESVQQGMLKLLEGAEIEVPIGASSKNAMVPMTTVDTKNILFICGGAFPELEEIIRERLNKSASIGFVSSLKDQYDEDENILSQVKTEDIRKFGMIPEFIGRLPVICALESLTEDMLVKILTEPKNAIIKQYKKLFLMDEVNLLFEKDALYAIAKKAKEEKVGARALRSVLEEYMLDIMYEIPKDDNIGTVTITADYIENHGTPRVEMRGVEVPKLEGETI